MKQINPKDRSMLARIAGNIAGPVFVQLLDAAYKAKPDKSQDIIEMAAKLSYGIAASIIEQVEMRIPCGKCDECKEGIQCREIPTEDNE